MITAHLFIRPEVVRIGYLVVPIRHRIVPRRVQMVPFAVQKDQIPGMKLALRIIGGISRTLHNFVLDSGFLEQFMR
ncbi:hypothetical protein D3C78_1898060 [compost metagenome]